MKRANPLILALNGGSSSIKFALFEAGASLERVLAGEIARIGLPGSTLQVQGVAPGDDVSRAAIASTYAKAVDALVGWLEERVAKHPIDAVGHRIVHGGPRHGAPERLTPELNKALRDVVAFDPEHLPEELLLSAAVHRRFPDLPQVACYDTTFHWNLPRVAQLLAIPRRYEAQGVRRYGFHGLSYAYLMEELTHVAGDDAARGRVILAHLGSGASLAALRDRKPVDTSMGFTPSSGIPMSTRSGDLDPGLVRYLASTEKMTARQFDEITTGKSGLLGVSETSSDMRDLLACEARDVRAAEAVSLFCYQAKKWIGAYAAALGGLETLVFSGGIAEASPTVRARICDGLGFLGISLDEKQNAASKSVISVRGGPVTVRVIATDEQIMIAKSVCGVLNLGSMTETKT